MMATDVTPDDVLVGRFDSSPEWARNASATLRRFVPGDPEPTRAERERQARALLEGDDLADHLAAAITRDRTAGVDQFRTALEHGIQAVPEASTALAGFFAALEARPAWVDDELLARGAEVCLRGGLTSLDVLADSSLMGGYRSSATTAVLVGTGRLVGERANRRLAETSEWWHECVRPGGLERSGRGWRLTAQVRLMHAMVNRRFLDADDWDVGAWGLPVNQGDQAGTLALFSSSYLVSLRALGVPVSRAEGRAVMHLWRYVGWLMGVDGHWLAETEGAGRRNFYHAMLFSPGPDQNSRILARSLAEAHGRTRFGRPRRLRQWLAYRKHLSLARLFQGRSGLSDLDLPRSLAWYPVLLIPVNLARHGLARVVPGGRRRLLRRADRKVAARIVAYRA